MNILKQLTIIFGVCLMGEVISKILPFTFPGSVLSMLIMLILLITKAVGEEHIDKASDFLLNNMSFFFIPIATGIIKEYDAVKESIFALVIIALVSTVITFFVVYYTVLFIAKLTEGKK